METDASARRMGVERMADSASCKERVTERDVKSEQARGKQVASY